MMWACVSVLLFYVAEIECIEVDLSFQDKLTDGELHYKELMKKAESYGDCWKSAMSDLHKSCKYLNEEVQSRLALSFANCFLKYSGIDPCPCSQNTPISDCLKNSSDRIFSTYREFFTHTQSICHYLLHREWQAHSAKTILMLTESSASVGKKLDEASKSQSKMLELQKSALLEQSKLMSNNKILKFELQKSRDVAKSTYNEFKIATNEYKILLFEVFDRVKNLQNFVLGEFSGVYTVIYYVIVSILIYVLTSVKRTADARFFLILILTVNAVLERTFIAYSLEGELLKLNPLDVNENVYSRIWLCRKISCVVCLIILVSSYYNYKDYASINNQLLYEIQQQNRDLQLFIKGIHLHENRTQNSQSCAVCSSNGNAIILGSPEEIKRNLGGRCEPIATSSPLNLSPSKLFHDKEIELLSPITPLDIRKDDKSESSSILNLLPYKQLENKETELSSNKASGRAKKVPKLKKEPKVQRKNISVINSSNTSKTSQPENSSQQTESPRSQRYNLRRSSRLTSPVTHELT